VTITSSDPSVENSGTEKVRVGFWVGSTAPAATSTLTGPTFTEIAADPVRPYVYVSEGGTGILVYNVYSATLVTTILSVAGQVGPMTVSHDGSTLYAVDLIQPNIVPVNLDTLAVGTPFPYGLSSAPQMLAYARTNGRAVVLSGNGRIFDAATGSQFAPLFRAGTAVAASLDGSRFCAADIGTGSAVGVACPTLDFTSLNGGQLLVGNTTFVAEGDIVNGSDIWVSADGTVVYVAAGTATTPHLSLYSTSTLAQVNSFAIQGRGNNVEIATDGRIFAGSTNVSIGQTADVRVFSAGGTPGPTYLLAPVGPAVILDRQMKISGDGIRLMAITGDPPLSSPAPALIFTTVGP
jgi:hypothetical protein